MPRTLPWLLNQKVESHVDSDATPRKRVKRELDSESNQTPRRPPSPSEKRDFFRSCMTSFGDAFRRCELTCLFVQLKAHLRLPRGHVPRKSSFILRKSIVNTFADDHAQIPHRGIRPR